MRLNFGTYGKGPKNGQRFSANFLNEKNDFKEAFLSNSLTDCPKFQFFTSFKCLLFVYNEIYLINKVKSCSYLVLNRYVKTANMCPPLTKHQEISNTL